ncbi:MAG TPA: hypothetical protein VMU39_13885 [Solirubrobacteraceae bacterium]|nr:hypothetical protein [Solirubrobacteraceae bacterium]
MSSQINGRRRIGGVLRATVAALSCAVAIAVIVPAGAGALPIGNGAKPCTPGQIKTENGKKYVCDKNGHWVHVLDLTAGGVVVATGGTQATGLTASTGGATGGVRMMDKNTGGGTAVTCGGGGKPGDYMEQRSYIYRNGQRIGFTTVTYICGEDGNWHTVAQMVSQPGLASIAGAIAAAVQAVRS